MKGVQKIAVAQEKANHFRASLENPPGLRIGAESQSPDGLKHSRPRFPADLRARIEHAGNRSNADGGCPCHLANRRSPWNCFHGLWPLADLGDLLATLRNLDPISCVSLAHQKDDGIPQQASKFAPQARSCKINPPYRICEILT
jgi:hypothetical protein